MNIRAFPVFLQDRRLSSARSATPRRSSPPIWRPSSSTPIGSRRRRSHQIEGGGVELRHSRFGQRNFAFENSTEFRASVAKLGL